MNIQKYKSFILFLIVLIITPTLIRQFLVTDSVIEMEIVNNKLFQLSNISVAEGQMWKSIDYAVEMTILFFDFVLVVGISIGLLRGFDVEYKSNEVLKVISEAYLIILFGYLMKLFYFTMMDDFSSEHFDNYQMLSLADFYSFENTDQVKYFLLSGYNLFRISALIYLVFSIYKLTNKNLKLALIFSFILGSIFFLIPLIGL
ncbi:hypothetical protein [Marivirga harenae]|uniref:hypothetical protein n=1 Tax=Marivirga harenae TaxID=2010992 RepID=UPI0026E0010F|nr:hypothetical protein [Marivirga harenae]WKV11069.1 hypothetical protein Q3Y49_12680 [Marivirga harenae]